MTCRPVQAVTLLCPEAAGMSSSRPATLSAGEAVTEKWMDG